ncbi:MAG: hypothetical protein RJQ09_13480 [Cyclobacteriaceae bacterium]
MIEKLSIYFSIFISSAVKFIAGPLIGAAANLTILETAVFTTLGMMLSVVLFTFLGPQMRFLISRFKKKTTRKFSKRSRRFVYIWSNYGIIGTAFLTPLILTPIGGAIVVNSFKAPPKKILSSMLISGIIWAVILSAATKYLKDFFL